jgi:hypothetical protein
MVVGKGILIAQEFAKSGQQRKERPSPEG